MKTPIRIRIETFNEKVKGKPGHAYQGVRILDEASGRRIQNCTRLEFSPLDSDHQSVEVKMTLINVPVKLAALARPVPLRRKKRG